MVCRHRDRKPENLFVHRSEEGTATIKILDFGIAKLTEDIRRTTIGKRRNLGGALDRGDNGQKKAEDGYSFCSCGQARPARPLGSKEEQRSCRPASMPCRP